MKVAELTIENTETRDKTIYKNLKYALQIIYRFIGD